MMLSLMALSTTDSIRSKSTNSVKITTKNHCFILLHVIYLIYDIIDFIHAQNGDMSVLPSLHYAT